MNAQIGWASGKRQAGSFLIASAVTLVLFAVLVPLGQWFDREPENPFSRPVSLAEMPVSPPPPELSKAAIPPLAQPTSSLSTSSIPMSPLPTDSPGLGAVTGELFAAGNFPVHLEAMDDLAVFEIAELDRVPRLVRNPARVVPYDLLRDDVRGQVRLKILIRADGQVGVLEVLQADHERLIAPARRFAERCRFEPPLREGEPVSAAYEFPITF